MKVSEQKAQYEKLLSMSQHVIRECDAEAKRLRKIADIFRNMAEQYDAMAEETDKMKRAVPIADEHLPAGRPVWLWQIQRCPRANEAVRPERSLVVHRAAAAIP